MKKYIITAGAEQEMTGTGCEETATGYDSLVVLTLDERDMDSICEMLRAADTCSGVKRIVFDVHAEVDADAVYKVTNGDRLDRGFNRLMVLLHSGGVTFYYTGSTKNNSTDIEVELPGLLKRDGQYSAERLIEVLKAKPIQQPVPRMDISEELLYTLREAEFLMSMSAWHVTLVDIQVPEDCLLDAKPITIKMKQKDECITYTIIQGDNSWELDGRPRSAWDLDTLPE